jgi:general secretion pathway protein A
MYKKFFGFKERPFNLVPDPAFLFLSKSHEEALAHLTYAIQQGDGFVEITGEVGTGKTTLCRVLLENLDDDTDVAYILNPKLDAIQLLKSINDEFHIESSADNTKDLIDTLNQFLIDKKAQGQTIILLIDEAQNLSMPVMEQIRLLSNLETTKSKLIQIILVGQPELEEMLNSHELRQLAQRITLSCHLRPLDLKETRDYILHRIGVAAKRQSVSFSKSAYRVIYRFSHGIPRLINVICDRALVVAFGLNQRQITGKVAIRAANELSFRSHEKGWKINWFKPAAVLLGACCFALIVFFWMRTEKKDLAELAHWESPLRSHNTFVNAERHNIRNGITVFSEQAVDKKTINDLPSEVKTTSNEVLEMNDSLPSVPSEEGAQKGFRPLDQAQRITITDASQIEQILGNLTKQSRQAAIASVGGLWSSNFENNPALEWIEKDNDFFQLAARQNGFLVRNMNGGLEALAQLNLPAILAFLSQKGGDPKYLSLVQIENSRVVLRNGDGPSLGISVGMLEKYWTGEAFILWRDFYHLSHTILPYDSSESVAALKIAMRDIGYKHLQITSIYDADTEAAVREMQKRHGLYVDGIVGPSTKIVFYNEVPGLNIPHILKYVGIQLESMAYH